MVGNDLIKRLIREEKFEEASEIARAQARAGAQVLDVCQVPMAGRLTK